ncbi:Probable indole-3-pyruvate monooxygenase YUCCA11 [Linum grandiflorum]
MKETTVIIVGAGPAGLATSACLNMYSIPNILLEREDCCASLWRKRAYDRLKLHLAKEFCELPYMPFPPKSSKFVPRNEFLDYLDEYVSRFEINPRYMKSVEGAIHDGERWRVKVKDLCQEDCEEVYLGKYLVVATGENSQGIVPELPGLKGFNGEVIHSNKYRNGERFEGKDVLVVGCGNSGMEIAHDLTNCGAKTSIVIRSPVHILTKGITYLGMRLMRYLPIRIVDAIVIASTKVVPAITGITGNNVEFSNGKTEHFDAIVFATGYKSTVRNWLKVVFSRRTMVSFGDVILDKTFSKMEETTVIIVGAGPAGLATSACLNMYSIPNILLEREDCCASLWRKRAYDRLKLHLAKQFCQLPHMPFPPKSPKFVPRNEFLNYLDDYVSKFEISPRYMKNVEGAIHDGERWRVKVKELCQEADCEEKVYLGKYLVVASGENCEGIVPELPGLEQFNGEVIHSNQYHNGERFKGKDVLVVGCGNSGMEIAHDLTNCGAKTSIVIRSPVHILTKKITDLGMHLIRYLPVKIVDAIVVARARDGHNLFNENGMPMRKFPNNWKGKNDIYCVGFGGKGLNGISNDAIQVATHIKKKIMHELIQF